MSAPEAEALDFRHVDTWLFDLDHTLYPPSFPVLRLIEQRIRVYMTQLTGLPEEEAWELQKKYLADYGGAVAGLVQHHDADPHEFLAFVHDVPLDSLSADLPLRAALKRLPGRRLVFTNGSQRHAERVLDRLDIADLFDDVFHTEAAGMVMKPDPRAFDILMRVHAVVGADTAFFEDRADNLVEAARRGMTTILVGEHAFDEPGAFVHHRTAELTPFLNRLIVKETR
ncbi:MAG: pyrimidine 5'-nucleotidase [Pseudomonadota bacterium]|jgi:putative hydrolase of the HAD superfamily